jgi:hypothetical protein
MILRYLFAYSLFLALVSCSSIQEGSRYPAEEVTSASCEEIAKSLFLSPTYKEDLEKALIDKKLLTITDKFVIAQHPHLEWINRARSSLNKSIKNWNNNKYPAFYVFSDEDVVTQAKLYFETVSSMVTPDLAVAPEASKNLETITSWMKAFENYKIDMDQLLEERISLQYNLSLLKKLKLKSDEPQDIKLMIKRKGVTEEEVVTLRESDKNLGYLKNKLKSEINELDGTKLKNGRIKDRIIRQAMLLDMMTIIQREFEHGIKNAEMPNPELSKELNRINDLLKKSEFQPTTYGVYRITNKVFIREMIALSKLDVAYKKFVSAPVEKLKEVVNAFIQNRTIPNQTTTEKVGIFKRIYAKITSITPVQAASGVGTAILTGLGVERYFTIKTPTVQGQPEDAPHQEQVERTKEEDMKKSNAHTEVIEQSIEELIKK